MTLSDSNNISELLHKGFKFDIETLLSILRKEVLVVPKDQIIKILSKSIFDNQYYTPNNVSKLMAGLGRINNPQNIIDITCGIGNILTYCDYSSEITGIDINKKVIELARYINPHIKFKVANSLEKRFSSKYELVFSVFPLGMRIRRNNKAYPGEILFIEKALSILKSDGVLICLVPISFLYNKTFLNIRNKILEKYNLQLIVNFPCNTLTNTYIRTSLLFIKNSRGTEKVYLANYKDNPDEIIENFKNNTGELYVGVNQLKDSWDIEFHDPIFIEIEKQLKGKEIKTIEEMAEVVLGYTPLPKERLSGGKYRIIGGRNLKNASLVKTEKDTFINYIDKLSFKRAILRSGDIIVSLLFDERKIYIYQDNDPKTILNNSCAIIRSPNNEYILSYLQTTEGQKLFLKQAKRATRGSIISRLSIEDVKKIKIPIIPIENLEKISNHAIRESTYEELEDLKEEMEFWKEELREQKLINKQQEEFFENRISRISEQKSTNDLLKRIKRGESKKLEFKSTLRLNLHTKGFDKRIENSALKTIAAFCNSEGGELLIGISDSGNILGIELDKFPTNDKYLLHLKNLITQRLGPLIVQLVDFSIVELEENNICKVTCKQSKEDVWLQSGGSQDSWEFYIRTGPSSTPLSPPDAVKYIKEHFK